MCVCVRASCLGMLTLKTTNHTGWAANRNHMCVSILKPFKHTTHYNCLVHKATSSVSVIMHSIFIHRPAKVRANDVCNGHTKSVYH